MTIKTIKLSCQPKFEPPLWRIGRHKMAATNATHPHYVDTLHTC